MRRRKMYLKEFELKYAWDVDRQIGKYTGTFGVKSIQQVFQDGKRLVHGYVTDRATEEICNQCR